jgi:hypothetical protein
MRRLLTSFLALTLTTTAAFAVPPKQLITHNTTDLESNAFVAGSIPSQYPTKAHSDGKVYWAAVRMACFGHIINNKCPALIRVGTNTDTPLDVGIVELNLETGEITPNFISNNGYTMMVNGPGESTLIKE